ncbi:MAG: NAD(P)/FAD-dependent oxidoreductase [Verrucomicrobia bacterium]|nr:NAD(P)/FAD-dependent oxidoreductase [Verrucomicrobiota bacterium]
MECSAELNTLPPVGVVGGGAAGFFGAIAFAEARPGIAVAILEQSAVCLSKVRISGGGRCNVTHGCFEPRELAVRYPRGERVLLGAFQMFQARDAVEWFEARGVKLKVEQDGRMFPITDSSETVIRCLQEAADRAGVKVVTRCGVKRMAREPDGKIHLELASGLSGCAERVLVATGGAKRADFAAMLETLGHSLQEPVPSLFTFHLEAPWVRELSGLSVADVELSVEGSAKRLRERGALLFTHWGLSGPAVLRLSAWGARALHECGYQFSLRVSWLPQLGMEGVRQWLEQQRKESAAKLLTNQTPPGLPSRLWAALLALERLGGKWAELSNAAAHRLSDRLVRTELRVVGKSLNKEEFVTCGGVKLGEVDFKTMESRRCSGLYFAGEILDVDGITGGFNFQAAWTTGWIAGRAMAASMAESGNGH